MSLQLAAGVTRKWAGVDSAWEPGKPEATKKLKKRADSHLSGVSMQARSARVAVGHVFGYAVEVQ